MSEQLVTEPAEEVTDAAENLHALLRLMAGSQGSHLQLAAFCEVWTIATRYVRTLRQAALGCERLVDGPMKQELQSLVGAHADVLAWFDACDAQFEQLYTAAQAAPAQLVH
jgi:hypothetical protein